MKNKMRVINAIEIQLPNGNVVSFDGCCDTGEESMQLVRDVVEAYNSYATLRTKNERLKASNKQLAEALRTLFENFDGDTEVTEIMDMLRPGTEIRAALTRYTTPNHKEKE